MALPSFVRHILGAASFARRQGQDEPAVPRGKDPVHGKPPRLIDVNEKLNRKVPKSPK